MTASSRQSRHLPAFILLALTEGPLHGHALRAVLQETLPGYKADAGATYRTLQALEEAGEVSFTWDTNSRGPARKVYTLTPAGWGQLEHWRADMEQRLAFLRIFLDRHDQARARARRALPE